MDELYLHCDTGWSAELKWPFDEESEINSDHSPALTLGRVDVKSMLNRATQKGIQSFSAEHVSRQHLEFVRIKEDPTVCKVKVLGTVGVCVISPQDSRLFEKKKGSEFLLGVGSVLKFPKLPLRLCLLQEPWFDDSLLNSEGRYSCFWPEAPHSDQKQETAIKKSVECHSLNFGSRKRARDSAESGDHLTPDTCTSPKSTLRALSRPPRNPLFDVSIYPEGIQAKMKILENVSDIEASENIELSDCQHFSPPLHSLSINRTSSRSSSGFKPIDVPGVATTGEPDILRSGSLQVDRQRQSIAIDTAAELSSPSDAGVEFEGKFEKLEERVDSEGRLEPVEKASPSWQPDPRENTGGAWLALPLLSLCSFGFSESSMRDSAAGVLSEELRDFVHCCGSISGMKVLLVLGCRAWDYEMVKAVRQGLKDQHIDFAELTSLELEAKDARILSKVQNVPICICSGIRDLSKLASRYGVPCRYVANATTWRWNPNISDFSKHIDRAAGPLLQELSRKLYATAKLGEAYLVKLADDTAPSGPGSPEECQLLHEGVQFVIQVCPPNLNPNLPDCLNSFEDAAKSLKSSYRSVLAKFCQSLEIHGYGMSLYHQHTALERSERKLCSKKSTDVGLLSVQSVATHRASSLASTSTSSLLSPSSNSPSPTRGVTSKQPPFIACLTISSHLPKYAPPPRQRNANIFNRTALYQYIKPIKQRRSHVQQSIFFEDELTVAVYDMFPKARYHILLLPKPKALGSHMKTKMPDSVSELEKDFHLELIRHLHDRAMILTKILSGPQFKAVDVRAGYHAVPSMALLHCHVISQDFSSCWMKTKKHWNSFTTDFFIPSAKVLQDLDRTGHFVICKERYEKMLKTDLSCHNCKAKIRTMPSLTEHLSRCLPSMN